MATNNAECFHNIKNYITKEDINLIISEYKGNNDTNVDSYSIHNASNKMLGFLAEYLKIKVQLRDQETCYFFVKAISRTNIAKADMVREMNLFDKEMRFYLDIKKIMDLLDLKPWSARLITVLRDALVFEDLNEMQYKIKNKFQRFDMAHTLQALKTLATFHASSIIFEENRKKEKHTCYKVTDDYSHVLHKGGYNIECEWYIQCMGGALEGLKSFSKYNETEFNIINNKWYSIWSSALDMNECDSEQIKVICHRDLWNNNIMFHYEKDGDELLPDDCLLVDFQAVRYQSPASDVMLLLCCNLDPKFRKENIDIFLNFYYEELQNILGKYQIKSENIMSKEEFLISAEEQTKWGLVICACLIPQFWIDDDTTTTIFSDNVQFDEILCKNKGTFIKNMMQANTDYKEKVIEIFEEIADRYCFK